MPLSPDPAWETFVRGRVGDEQGVILGGDGPGEPLTQLDGAEQPGRRPDGDAGHELPVVAQEQDGRAVGPHRLYEARKQGVEDLRERLAVKRHVRESGEVGELLVGRLEGLEGAIPLDLRGALLAPLLGLGDLALYDRRQTLHVVLRHEVPGARLHGLERGGHVDHARDEDERHVQAALVEGPQRVQAAEAGEAVVRQHDVPLTGAERVGEPDRVLDALRGHIEATSSEPAQHELGVVDVVLDDQNPQRWDHATDSQEAAAR